MKRPEADEAVAVQGLDGVVGQPQVSELRLGLKVQVAKVADLVPRQVQRLELRVELQGVCQVLDSVVFQIEYLRARASTNTRSRSDVKRRAEKKKKN